MTLYLKDSDDIAALIAGETYSAISTDRKTQIAQHFEAMPASVWQAALDVILTSYSANEQAFATALFTNAPPAEGSAAPPADGSVFTVPFTLAGALENNQVFGYFTLPASASVTGIAATLQAPDAAAAVAVSLVDGTGAAYGESYEITLGAGAANGFNDVSGNPLALNAGDILQAKVNYTASADASAPAQQLAITIICRQ